MSIRHRIDSEQRRVHVTVEGISSTEEIRQTVLSIAADPRFRPGYDVLSDHTRVERAITMEQLHGLVALLRAHSDRFAPVRWAIVTARPTSYAMMRVLASRAELEMGMAIRVFTDFDAAEQWLAEGRDNAPAR